VEDSLDTVTDIEFQFVQPAEIGKKEAPGAVSQTRFLNFTDGIIDQFRVSGDNNGSTALDIHIASPSLQKVIVYYVGPNIPQSAVVASPVMGATPFSGSEIVSFGSSTGL
jgi:hypothetical protein